MIVDDPKLGPIEGNVIHQSGQDGPCKHLLGDTNGQYSCAIHNEPWYKDTPCFRYSQIETNIETPCRMGLYILAI